MRVHIRHTADTSMTELAHEASGVSDAARETRAAPPAAAPSTGKATTHLLARGYRRAVPLWPALGALLAGCIALGCWAVLDPDTLYRDGGLALGLGLAAAVLLAVGVHLALLLRSTREALFRTRVREMEVGQYVALGRLASSIAHEVRNPLHNLGLLLNDLQGLALIDETRQSEEVIRRIKANCSRIDYAVTLVYTLARPGEVEHRLTESAPYPLSEALTDLEEHLTPEMHNRVTFFDHLPQRIKVNIPRESLVIVLDNLIRNACQASSESPVYVDAALGDRAIEIKIFNEGKIGRRMMQELSLKEIPEGRVSGLGLGVFIIRHLAKQMKIELDYQCTETVVTATVRIPIHYRFGMF